MQILGLKLGPGASKVNRVISLIHRPSLLTYFSNAIHITIAHSHGVEYGMLIQAGGSACVNTRTASNIYRLSVVRPFETLCLRFLAVAGIDHS